MKPKEYKIFSDEEICNCEDYQNKNRFGFTVLFNRYNSNLISRCKYKYPNEDHNEIVQETWIKVFKYLEFNDKKVTNFKGILYRSFDYSCKEYLKNKKKDEVIERRVPIEEIDFYLDESKQNELYEKILQQLDTIPLNRKEQFLLRYQECYTWEQIASTYQSTSESIRKYCERLKKKIQNSLKLKKPSK